jgi:hypothetical protein
MGSPDFRAAVVNLGSGSRSITPHPQSVFVSNGIVYVVNNGNLLKVREADIRPGADVPVTKVPLGENSFVSSVFVR